jgi:RNA polymerase sigma-70 factor, ECF subfamily
VREPEPEIIRRAQAGDLEAFETLVRGAQADAFRFAFHLTGDRGLAEDVTQEAFLRAYRALRSFHGEAKFSSWLLRIVRNCAVDAYRKTRREVTASIEREDPAAPAPSDDRLRIAEAIRRLPMELREPFVAIEILGFNYAEASAILHIKTGTLKSRMYRARLRLMRALADDEAAHEM